MPDSQFLILIDYDSRECAVLVFASLHFPSFCPQFANPSNGVIGINYREVPCDSKPKHDLGPVGFPPGSPSPSLLYIPSNANHDTRIFTLEPIVVQ